MVTQLTPGTFLLSLPLSLFLSLEQRECVREREREEDRTLSNSIPAGACSPRFSIAIPGKEGGEGFAERANNVVRERLMEEPRKLLPQT